mgnify:CR=1 FL=1
MCTVTLIPLRNSDFILTSNRDESPNRNTFNPNIYSYNDVKLLYPKDEKAGGTWIGASSNKRVLCLLNGAFICHKRKESYKLSRGVVVKDLLVCEDVIKTTANYNFDNIEPFTLIIVDWNSSLEFYELIWDGNEKHFSKLKKEPQIWSSSTLYTTKMKMERLDWFNTFKSQNILDAKSILKFHNSTKKENKDYGVIMNRQVVKTTSITQIEKKKSSVKMHFYNLNTKTYNSESLNCLEVINE